MDTAGPYDQLLRFSFLMIDLASGFPRPAGSIKSVDSTTALTYHRRNETHRALALGLYGRSPRRSVV